MKCAACWHVTTTIFESCGLLFDDQSTEQGANDAAGGNALLVALGAALEFSEPLLGLECELTALLGRALLERPAHEAISELGVVALVAGDAQQRVANDGVGGALGVREGFERGDGLADAALGDHELRDGEQAHVLEAMAHVELAWAEVLAGVRAGEREAQSCVRGL